MFGAFTFGQSYFGQGVNIDVNELPRLDHGTAVIRTLAARATVRVLNDRLTLRTLRARHTVQETNEP